MNKPSRGNLFALLAIIIPMIPIAGVGFIIGAAMVIMDIDEESFSMVTYMSFEVIYALAIILLIYIYLDATKKRFKDVFRFKMLSFKNYLFVILITVCLWFIVDIIAIFTAFFFHDPVEGMLESFKDLPLILMILSLGVKPAIFEELVMRGIVLSEYKDVPIAKAALVNGFIFGAFHLNFQQFFYAFTLGIVLAYLAYYTESILAPILSHFVFNMTSVLYVYFSDFPESEAAMFSYDKWIAALIPALIYSAVFLPILILLLRSFIKYNRNRLALCDEAIDAQDTGADGALAPLLEENAEADGALAPLSEDALPMPAPAVKQKVFTVSFWLIVIVFVVFSVLVEVSTRYFLIE